MPLKLTWRPVDIGTTRDFLIGTFALWPAIRRHQGAGGGFRSWHQIVWAKRISHGTLSDRHMGL